jgi:hypothetical protein
MAYAGPTGRGIRQQYDGNVVSLVMGATLTDSIEANVFSTDWTTRSAVKTCIDTALGIPAASRRIMRIGYAQQFSAATVDGRHTGTGYQHWGFEGYQRVGNYAVRSTADSLVDLHEMMHQYNWIHIGWLAQWMDEGFAVAIGRRSCHAKQALDNWRAGGRYAPIKAGTAPPPAQSSPHLVGSAYFEGVTIEIPTCQQTCLEQIWKNMALRTPKNVNVTVAELRAATRSATGNTSANNAKIDAILTLLQIPG